MVVLEKTICSNCVYKDTCKKIQNNNRCGEHKTPHQKRVEERNSSKF